MAGICRLDVLNEEGIDVATQDKAAWDAAVAAFKKTHRTGIARLAFSSVGGIVVEPVTVLGAAELGLDGLAAIHKQGV